MKKIHGLHGAVWPVLSKIHARASSPPWRRVVESIVALLASPLATSLRNSPRRLHPERISELHPRQQQQKQKLITKTSKSMEPSTIAQLQRKSVVRFEPELEERRSEPSLALQVEIPPSASPLRRRARSTGSLLEPGETERHRYRLCYQDDAYRLRSEARARSLMAAAASPPSSTSALLARKALKYRKVLDRMNGVDVLDPEFDVSKFLGVDWCKTEAPKDLA